MTKESTKKEVAKKENTEVAEASNYGELAGQGFETMSSSDLSIPFLSILQSNSPVVENDEVEGAKSGMLYNTVNREVLDGEKGLVFQPCHKDHAYVEWVPRDAGGGFVAVHTPNSDVVAATIAHNNNQRYGKLKMENGNELIETHYVYGLVLNEDGSETEDFAVLSFTSTKITPVKNWFTAMYKLKGQPPLFANRARIRTVKQKNDKGSFYNFRIDPLKPTWKESLIPADNELIQEGIQFKEMVTSGMAKAAHETENAAGGTDEAGDGSTPF